MFVGQIPAEEFQAPFEVRMRNEYKQNSNHVNVCFLCGRGLTAKSLVNSLYIHLHTNGNMVQRQMELNSDEDQGWFPVGSECAKRLPAEYKSKLAPIG